MKNIIADYNACPGVDCTAAFENALLDGGAIAVPRGTYLISRGLVTTRPTRLIGDGMTMSVLAFDVASNVNGLTFRPAAGENPYGWGVHDLGIVPATVGKMQRAIQIDLSRAGAYLAQTTFQRVYLVAGDGAGSAFRLDNPVNTDGFFVGEITGKSLIVGGITLLRLGDSFTVCGAQITGPNVGFYATAVPGAAQCKLLDCNITSTGGAVFMDGMKQAKIVGNQMEQSSTYDGPFNGMCVLSGCMDCDLSGNNMNAYGNTSCVVIENGSTGNILSANIMIATAGYGHLLVGAGSPGNALASDNRYYSASNGARMMTPFASINTSSPMWVL